jgi:hypothetical protein
MKIEASDADAAFVWGVVTGVVLLALVLAAAGVL